MQKQDNLVRLCGRIVNRYDKDKVTILTLSVAETSRNGEQRMNHPRIYFFHSDGAGAEQFFRNDQVAVTAHVATPRKYRNTGEEYVSQALVGDTITTRKSMYELLDLPGMGRGPLEPQMNEAVFTGTLSSIRKLSDRSAQIILDTVNDGHRNNITMNIANTDAFQMQIGDRVTVTGKIVTGYYVEDERGNLRLPTPEYSEKKNSDEKEKRHYFQRVLGLSIVKVEENKTASVAEPEIGA